MYCLTILEAEVQGQRGDRVGFLQDFSQPLGVSPEVLLSSASASPTLCLHLHLSLSVSTFPLYKDTGHSRLDAL